MRNLRPHILDVEAKQQGLMRKNLDNKQHISKGEIMVEDAYDFAQVDKEFKFADDNWDSFKVLDDVNPAVLTSNAKVRIKNDSGYLMEVSANINGSQAVVNRTAGSIRRSWDLFPLSCGIS